MVINNETRHKMKDLHYYKRSLRICNAQIMDAFDITLATLTGWLNRGAPIHVLRSLDMIDKMER